MAIGVGQALIQGKGREKKKTTSWQGGRCSMPALLLNNNDVIAIMTSRSHHVHRRTDRKSENIISISVHYVHLGGDNNTCTKLIIIIISSSSSSSSR